MFTLTSAASMLSRFTQRLLYPPSSKASFAGRARPRRCRLWVEELERRDLLSLMGNSLFPADSPWNQNISNAPVAANSATLVNSLGANSSFHPDFGTTWAGSLNGIPINVVSGTQPKIHVVVDAYADESDLLPVPIPANAVLEGDPLPSAQNSSDRHLIVYDQDNNVTYELFNASRPAENADGQWHCDSEAFWNMNTDYYRTPGFTSADAAGLPILPGLVRPDEVLDQKQITHALRFTVNNADKAYVFPASHAVGSNNINYPPMGERFRLKENFDISGFSPANKVILQALKTYGMIVADIGSSWYLSGQPSTRWDDNDLHALGQLTGSDFEAIDATSQPAQKLLPPTLVNPVGNIQNATPTFTWNSVAGAAYYDVWVDDLTSHTSQILRNQHVTATSLPVANPLPSGDQLEWWVQAHNNGGNASLWSAGLSFTIVFGTPNLVGPTGSVQNASPTFNWSAVNGTAYYDLWVNDTTSGQSQVIRNQQVPGTSYGPSNSLTPGHGYLWWVRAFAPGGAGGLWTAGMAFTVTPLGLVTQTGPTGAVQNAQPPFVWQAVAGADYYDVWVNDLTAGTSQVLRNAKAPGTSWTPPGVLSPTHIYQWWVRALANNNDFGPWGNGVQFTVALLNTPTLAGVGGSPTPSFAWNAVSGASYYDLWVDDWTAGTSQVLRNTHVPVASFTATSPLPLGHVYRWWIKAWSNNGDYSAWSNFLTFSL